MLTKYDKKLSIVFPAYNEEDNIAQCVMLADCALSAILKDYEIIVVNDGSSDATEKICADLAGSKIPRLKLINKEKNEGYGFALRDGFKAAKFGLVCFSDADRQFDMFSLEGLLKYSDDYPVVIGYRKHRQDTLLRRTLSAGYNNIVKLLFGLRVRDLNCALKLFRKDVINKIDIKSNHYFINAEILVKAKKLGYKIKEVPVPHFPRFHGSSKVAAFDIPRTLKEIALIYKDLNNK